MSVRGCLVMAVVVATACGPPSSEVGPTGLLDPDSEPVALLDPVALTPVDAASDPLAHHRPPEVDCPSATWGPEGGGFEIQTGACNYGAFEQPLPMSVEAGDALHIIVWHDTIDLPEPATAHVAVWLGRTVVWEAEFAIPAPSRSFEVTVPIEDAPWMNVSPPV